MVKAERCWPGGRPHPTLISTRWVWGSRVPPKDTGLRPRSGDDPRQLHEPQVSAGSAVLPLGPRPAPPSSQCTAQPPRRKAMLLPLADGL